MKKIFVILAVNVITAWSINWLSLHRGGYEKWGHSRSCKNGRQVYGFTRGQTRTCRSQVEVMPQVSHAATTTVTTCQRIFHSRRWNCSSILNAPHLSRDLTSGTREQAVVYALSSAAVTWAVSRACSQGTLVLCGCGRVPHEPPNGHFKWGGCGDNVKFGAAFARDFIDARNNKNTRLTVPGRLRRGTEEDPEGDTDGWSANSARHHREVQPYTPYLPTHVSLQTRNTRRRSSNKKRENNQGKMARMRLRKKNKRRKKGKRQKNQAITMMNHHNNRVGRRVVKASLSTQCKCHGVSGSCNIKTCWKALPNFIEAGERLYRGYLSGVEVREVSAGPRLRLLPASPAVSRFSRDDLIYVTKSPDYCHPEPRVGSLGTGGRRCNATSRGVDGCSVMCCGRGYTSHSHRTHLRCHCKYHWCCYVTCQTCAVRQEIHTCN
ncbi:protein Wnt-11b-like isoform X1 [Homarus americanus]|uniref:protein Wnt-11b-like isoform X1 n=1 Tax=Homarus americanus TaxID=6706 RepID=UPI001C4746AF|nr:protein Wnt-11b-like isoform X1 [Homarus americanus]